MLHLIHFHENRPRLDYSAPSYNPPEGQSIPHPSIMCDTMRFTESQEILNTQCVENTNRNAEISKCLKTDLRWGRFYSSSVCKKVMNVSSIQGNTSCTGALHPEIYLPQVDTDSSLNSVSRIIEMFASAIFSWAPDRFWAQFTHRFTHTLKTLFTSWNLNFVF